MVQKVEAYVTSDGQMFISKDAAEEHEDHYIQREQLMALLERGSEREEFYIGHRETDVLTDITSWLLENAETVRNIFK